MTPQEILDKSLTKLTKEEQTAIVGMADRYGSYMAGNVYIPLQDLPKYKAAYKRLHK